MSNIKGLIYDGANHQLWLQGRTVYIGAFCTEGATAKVGFLHVPRGTAAEPSLSFQSADGTTTDPDTGLFSNGANEVGLACAGSAVLSCTASGVTLAQPAVLPVGSAAAPSLTFTGDTNTGIYHPAADQVGVSAGGALLVNCTNTAGTTAVAITPAAKTSGVRSAFSLTAAADTGLTDATAQTDVLIDLGRAVTWAAGAGPLAAQTAVYVLAPTYNGDVGGALTITNAATFAINSAPIDGANLTLTHRHALWLMADSFSQGLVGQSQRIPFGYDGGAGGGTQVAYTLPIPAGYGASIKTVITGKQTGTDNGGTWETVWGVANNAGAVAAFAAAVPLELRPGMADAGYGVAMAINGTNVEVSVTWPAVASRFDGIIEVTFANLA